VTEPSIAIDWCKQQGCGNRPSLVAFMSYRHFHEGLTLGTIDLDQCKAKRNQRTLAKQARQNETEPANNTLRNTGRHACMQCTRQLVWADIVPNYELRYKLISTGLVQTCRSTGPFAFSSSLSCCWPFLRWHFLNVLTRFILRNDPLTKWPNSNRPEHIGNRVSASDGRYPCALAIRQ
jgi:hypothetical protein